MTETATPPRRRAIVAVTATLTALATVAAMGVLTAATSTPSAASTPEPDQVAASTNPTIDLLPTPASAPVVDAVMAGSAADIKNVVLILADDLDWELFKQVPRLAALQAKGMTFTNNTVTDSLCCPSRTSIMRGQYIHNHGVISNLSSTGGGWPTFRDRGEHTDCLPVWLQSAGVTTALFGKYLNDYPDTPKSAHYVPPGWSKWAVPTSRGASYAGYYYTLNTDGVLHKYRSAPEDFLNDVLTTKAVDFVQTAPEGFFLTLSTYNPHKPSPVAVRNKSTHLTTIAPRNPNYNVPITNPPSWIRAFGPVRPWKLEQLDQLWRQRAQSAESVADSVDAVLAALEQSGRTSDTLVVVTSDNGYHAGAHQLANGKRTAYREDTVVPMVVLGPGVTPGARIDAMTSTVDLAPTFTALLGAQAPAWVDGRSLSDIIFTGAVPETWRNATLSESMGVSRPEDPDYQEQAPPPFTALRTPDWLFVVYQTGERELYDLTADPFEMNNIAATADTRLVADLYSQLQAMKACAGATCRTADAL